MKNLFLLIALAASHHLLNAQQVFKYDSENSYTIHGKQISEVVYNNMVEGKSKPAGIINTFFEDKNDSLVFFEVIMDINHESDKSVYIKRIPIPKKEIDTENEPFTITDGKENEVPYLYLKISCKSDCVVTETFNWSGIEKTDAFGSYQIYYKESEKDKIENQLKILSALIK